MMGKTASPGNISQLEDLLFTDSDMVSDAVSMAIKISTISLSVKSRSSSCEIFPGLAVLPKSQRALFFLPACPSSGSSEIPRPSVLVHLERSSFRHHLQEPHQELPTGMPYGAADVVGD
jgi:hypothetical protein